MKTYIEQMNSRRQIELIAAFLLSAAVLLFIQFAGPNIVDYDGYYHIKMAELIKTQGLPTPFPYLPFTILDEKGYNDHHTLLHIVQIPFTLAGDLRLAAKLSAVFCAAIAFATFFWLLRTYRVPYPWLWLALLFASSAPFLYRMSMPRAPSLSLALQLIASHLILKRNYKALAALCVIFVWTYNAFPTVAALVFIGMVVFAITEKKLDYKLMIAGGTGLIAGLIINPYFPANIMFLWNHIVPKIFAFKYQTSVGSEWYPYNSWLLFSNSAVAVISYVAGLMWTNREEWKSDPPRLFWFLTASMYLFLLLKSRRFVEYFPPSAVLFLAFSLRHALTGVRLRAFLKDSGDKAIFAALLLLVFGFAVRTIDHVREDIREEPNSLSYKAGAEWLKENTPEGSIVFNTDWDDFPMLFHYNTHNRYIVGLDADFMRLKNEPLYREYEKITRGEIDKPADDILSLFNSRFVLTDNRHKAFMKKAAKDSRFVERFSDDYTTIYEINDQRASN